MSHTRAERACLTGALTLLLAATTTGTAQAAYDDVIQLSWDGETYASVLSESFLGEPVTVPGDSASRTVVVRNDGPTAGVLRASVVDVELLDPESSDTHHATGEDQGSFYDDLVLHWPDGEATFTELAAAGTTPVLEVVLDQGEEVPLALSYELPVDATSGNTANVAPREASFDVLLEIGGTLPAVMDEEQTPPANLDGTAVPPATRPPAQLGQTGVEVGLLLGGAALLVGIGAAALRRARRSGPQTP
ncbi:hypothetical protein FE251_11765 [Georgenia wutianyii]|uniref:LPXTG cell wall anchor domain-containing protein n=1 Tax=Georgenia wutianyii TaxID=2585135 RepID=A0ABX5VPL4_9MICO|nr:hypothetical protein [Georgenia wutianyii]QDB79978.1 hypothetical protein FE251_11765 [Georgenia wutianyii]